MYFAKKRFGQNFLVDEYIINNIINTINPNIAEDFVEIGPGFAALTKPLLTIIKKLSVIEIDRDIISFLKKSFNNSLVIYEADALKFDYNTFSANFRVIGNLPYNISTALLFHLSSFNHIKDMHFMLQKEVVNRICAKPNTSDYGRLSVMLQYKYTCSKMFEIEKKSFNPVPKVDSAIVRLVPKALKQDINEKQLNHIVVNAFSQRRKTISNSLKNVIDLSLLEKYDINRMSRAENLTITDYINLAQG